MPKDFRGKRSSVKRLITIGAILETVQNCDHAHWYELIMILGINRLFKLIKELHQHGLIKIDGIDCYCRVNLTPRGERVFAVLNAMQPTVIQVVTR